MTNMNAWVWSVILAMKFNVIMMDFVGMGSAIVQQVITDLEILEFRFVFQIHSSNRILVRTKMLTFTVQVLYLIQVCTYVYLARELKLD